MALLSSSGVWCHFLRSPIFLLGYHVQVDNLHKLMLPFFEREVTMITATVMNLYAKIKKDYVSRPFNDCGSNYIHVEDFGCDIFL